MTWRRITFLSLLLCTVVTIAGYGAASTPAPADTSGLAIELHTNPEPPVAVK